VLRSNAPQQFYWIFVAARHLLSESPRVLPKIPQNLSDQRVDNDADTKAIELGVPKYGPRQWGPDVRAIMHAMKVRIATSAGGKRFQLVFV
jgi:hypothetical protein